MADYDLLGNIAIIKTDVGGRDKSDNEKAEQAKELMKRESVKTVIEKASNVKGRLRKIKVKHIAGVQNLVADYKENNCRFKFDVAGCYFSPRLANDRKEVAKMIGSKERVLVMFAGVGVYPIIIYKLKRPKEVIGIEISKDCCKWFKENIKLNKISENRVKVIQGDVKKKVEGLGKFDFIMMARPNLKESFLKYALSVSKKGTRISYHGFCRNNEIDSLVDKLKKEAKEEGKRIKIIKIMKAGDIAPYKFRYRVDMEVKK